MRTTTRIDSDPPGAGGALSAGALEAAWAGAAASVGAGAGASATGGGGGVTSRGKASSRATFTPVVLIFPGRWPLPGIEGVVGFDLRLRLVAPVVSSLELRDE
jgi:hypothetical protein